MVQRDPKTKKERKKERKNERTKTWSTKKPKHVTCHVFVETTDVFAALHGWACVVTGHTRDTVIYSRFSIHGFWSYEGSKFALWHYLGYCLLQQRVLPHKPWQPVIPLLFRFSGVAENLPWSLYLRFVLVASLVVLGYDATALSIPAVFKLGSADQRGSATGSHGVLERIPKSSHYLHGF